MGDVVAVELDLTTLRLDQTGDHVEGRSLAGAVGTKQPHRLPAPHVEVHVIYDEASAIALGEAVRGQIAFHIGSPARRARGARFGRDLARLAPRGRDRSAQGGQIHVLPTPVGFAGALRRATVAEQREDVAHALPRSPPIQASGPAGARNIAHLQ